MVKRLQTHVRTELLLIGSSLHGVFFYEPLVDIFTLADMIIGKVLPVAGLISLMNIFLFLFDWEGFDLRGFAIYKLTGMHVVRRRC